MTKRTQDELLAELHARFGNDPMEWGFTCPACGDVATGQDFRDALTAKPIKDRTASDFLGQVCIGRLLGALQVKSQKEWHGRGCDWCAYGLFAGPDFVTDEKGKQIACFEIAPANYERSAV